MIEQYYLNNNVLHDISSLIRKQDTSNLKHTLNILFKLTKLSLCSYVSFTLYGRQVGHIIT